MKKWTSLSSILFLLFILLFSNCSKEEKDAEPAAKAEMRAFINGEAWEANNSSCIILDSIASIRTKCSEKPDIEITFYTFKEGSYTLSADGSSFAMISCEKGIFTTMGSEQAGGNLGIDAINSGTSKINGSFEFVAVNALTDETISVTGGNFENIPYIYVTSPGINNSLQAVIEGLNYVASDVETIIIQNKMHLISKKAGSGKELNLSFPVDISPGTYDFYSGSIKGTYINEENKEFAAGEGVLEIIKHDLKKEILSGYFSFEASDTTSGNTLSISNGNFYIRY